MVQLDIPTLNLLLGVAIPLLVAALTRLRVSSGVKAVANLGLSALAGGLTAVLTTDGAFEFKTLLIGFLTTWGTSILSYYGLHKPTGLVGAVAVQTAGFGLNIQSSMESKYKGAQSAGSFGDEPPLGVLVDKDDSRSACDLKDDGENPFITGAITDDELPFVVMSPEGDEAKIREYGELFPDGQGS